MNLFCVVGEIKDEYSVVRHYVVNSEYEATERFLSEYRKLDFFNISIREIEDVDGFNIFLKPPGICNIPAVDKVYNIKCCCCQFNITVSNGIEKVVCSHCRTINDVNLQLSLYKYIKEM